MFVDEVDITAAAGNGGSGCMSFRREKFVPRGGPDGGNGGNGGSVYLVASPNLNTLVSFRYHPDFKAQRGGHGMGANRTGKSGADLDIAVPPGTVAASVDPETGERHQVADLADENLFGARGTKEFARSADWRTEADRILAQRAKTKGEP